jgi:hypothetical protein
MRATSPKLRVVAAGLAVLLAGLSIAACDTGYKFGSAPGGRGPGSLGPDPSSASGATPSSVLASAPPCTAGDLIAKGGRRQDPDDAGDAIGNLIMSDSSANPCELRGVPVVDLLTSAGRPLGVEVAAPVTQNLPPVVLQSRARNSGEVVFTWQNWCASPPGALEMRLGLAAKGGTLLVPLDGQLGSYVPICSNPKKPSTLRIQYAYVNAGTTKISNA